MPGLNWTVIETAPLRRDPFDHILVSGALLADCAALIPAEYPAIRSPGSFSLEDAEPGPVLTALVDDLLSDRLRTALAGIFGLDLQGHPALVTLRGQCSSRDGQIHTDSRSKLFSLLLYLNEDWPRREAQLRLLRGGSDLSDYAVEVSPTMGSLVAFTRTENSWHGHSTFVGQRRVLQLNYLQSARASFIGSLRHRLSALAKHPA
jgi:hypothetical protein